MKHAAVLICLALGSILLGGCGSGSADMNKKDEADFKQAIDNGKGEFDLNKVPEDKRDMVRGFMEANKGGPSAPKTGGESAPTSGGGSAPQ
jgi:ABC-type Fe3+-citrate transport system substrate-binding protein